MVRVEGLRKTFVGHQGEVHAVDGIGLDVAEGSFFTLLGPSGCGKSTTLRCIAGLETPDAGEIEVDGAVVYSSTRRSHVPPHRRDIGMVFQSYAIWPHMTVFENAAFPLRVGKQRFTSDEIEGRVKRALELVRLEGLEDRPAPFLSGGQQQRLALARALVRQPKVLLLDEPLSNLDARLREHMRLELRLLQRRIGVTAIYVTHDQLEALALSTVVAVMSDGRLMQVGPPREIYERPESHFVADFFGAINFIRGRLTPDGRAASGVVETEHGPIECYPPEGLGPGSPVLLSVRPENLSLHTERPVAMRNVWPAKVETMAFLGEFIEVQLAVGDASLRARADPQVELRAGQEVYLQFHPGRCTVLPAD